MGPKFSISTSNLFQNFSFFSSLKKPSFDQSTFHRPGIIATLPSKPPDFTFIISSCISAASAATQKYLVFKDPEDKFHPSPQVLTQVFLMTCITKSVDFHVTDIFSCTAMTAEQRILLGADWVWAVLEKPTRKPKIQIVVQVLHQCEREEANRTAACAEACRESIQIAQTESSHKNLCERMVEFCTSVGSDSYALFLFFGKKDDKDNIYGVLSNNMRAAVGKCDAINRVLIENLLRGSQYFHTALGMMRAVLSRKTGDSLTLLVKFS